MAKASHAVDDLFELRNMFVIGNYQGAINEGMVVNPSDPDQKRESDVLVYRSYIAKGDYKIGADALVS